MVNSPTLVYVGKVTGGHRTEEDRCQQARKRPLLESSAAGILILDRTIQNFEKCISIVQATHAVAFSYRNPSKVILNLTSKSDLQKKKDVEKLDLMKIKQFALQKSL